MTQQRSIATGAFFAVFVMLGAGSAAAQVKDTPAPEIAETPATEVAIFAGGCFWGVQGVFQHVTGVTRALSGYDGGEERTAHYEIVGTGGTHHAESVEVTFDPRQISYGRLLQIFFSVIHDPTELNRQGPDVGSQYRSAIFPTTDDQARTAAAFIAGLDQAHVFKSPIVTKIESGHKFYPAEGYHQDYLTLNPAAPYIAYNDIPKVKNLKRLFPDIYRSEPVLVSGRKMKTPGL